MGGDKSEYNVPFNACNWLDSLLSSPDIVLYYFDFDIFYSYIM